MNYLIKLLLSISAFLFSVLALVLYFEEIEENVAHRMSYEMYLSKVRAFIENFKEFGKALATEKLFFYFSQVRYAFLFCFLFKIGFGHSQHEFYSVKLIYL